MTQTIPIEDTAKWIDGLVEKARPIVIQSAAAGSRHCLEGHFIKRQSEPRKDGFPAVGFWANTNGRSVNEAVQDTIFARDSAKIRIESAPLAHKMNPNPPTIRPGGGKKFLTIPAIAEATRKPAGDFMGLKFTFVKSDRGERPALVRGEDEEVVFWLARKANTPHDPRALPTDAEIGKSILDAVKPAINQLLNSSLN